MACAYLGCASLSVCVGQALDNTHNQGAPTTTRRLTEDADTKQELEIQVQVGEEKQGRIGRVGEWHSDTKPSKDEANEREGPGDRGRERQREAERGRERGEDSETETDADGLIETASG